MFRLNLKDIDEDNLKSLEQSEIPESIKLEFKRELNLADRRHKAEAAKDVSAMANTVGGRIFYGVDEKSLADGSVVAGPIAPLTDGTIDSRLEDVLLSSIHPRPHIQTHKVSVQNNAGFVLVVEVRPAYASDLHMVTGFKEYRFYRRGEMRTILMTEPEIRERYLRIATSWQALDAEMEKACAEELALVPKTQESVLVIPWFGHRDLVNPRHCGHDFGGELYAGPLNNTDWKHVIRDLKVVSDGYRGYGGGEQLHDCQIYACVRRTGLVHFACATAAEQTHNPTCLPIHECLAVLFAALVTSHYVLDKCSYWGPVRVIHRLNISSPFHLTNVAKGENWELYTHKKPITPGVYEHTIPEVDLREQGGSIKLVLRELLHQIFQTSGEAACPWFVESGDIDPKMESFLPPELFKHLSG